VKDIFKLPESTFKHVESKTDYRTNFV